MQVVSPILSPGCFLTALSFPPGRTEGGIRLAAGRFGKHQRWSLLAVPAIASRLPGSAYAIRPVAVRVAAVIRTVIWAADAGVLCAWAVVTVLSMGLCQFPGQRAWSCA
jgi:hypothetical protein